MLDLDLGPINLNLLGLNVATSKICLDVTATKGGGLLGDLLCGGLTTALAGATAATSTAAANPGSAVDLSGVLKGLNSVLGNSTLLGGLGSVASGLMSGGFAPTMAPAATNILHLSLGPVNLSLLGLNVTLDNCKGGPVTVDITAIPGPGNLLGNLLSSLDNLLNNPGSPVGGILTQLNKILGIVTKTPPVA